MKTKTYFCKFLLILCLFFFFKTNVIAQWTQINLLKDKTINDILIDSKGYIYVAGEDSGLYRSKDNLRNWERINNGLPSQNEDITKILEADNCLLIKLQGGLYRSTDTGDSWHLLKSDSPNEILMPIGYFNQIIFAANKTYLGSFTSLFASADSGKTWIATDQNINSIQVNCLTIKDSNLFLGTQNGVYKSTDMGKNWIAANSNLKKDIVDIVTISNYLYVSTGNITMGDSIWTSIYYSNNDGNSWLIQDVGGYLTTEAIANYMGTLVRGVFYDGVEFLSTPGGQFQNGGPVWHTTKCFGVRNDTLLAGEEYYYFTKGTGGVWLYALPYTAIDKGEYGNRLDSYRIDQNYPNPFNPTTKIKYSIATSAKVTIKVYDVLGKEIKILVNDYQYAGTYEVEFDASNLTSGIYFYKFSAGDYSKVKKMILLK